MKKLPPGERARRKRESERARRARIRERTPQQQDLAGKLISRVEYDTNGGCWLWPGATISSGYGKLTWKGKRVLVHRAAHEIWIGPIPDDLGVLHHCDVRPCFNPAHLWSGDEAANNHDCVAKGRNAKGERNGNAKLTAREVRQIKADRRSEYVVADAFGVTVMTVNRIMNGKRWKHV